MVANFTLNSMPNHILQYNYLPIKILNHIDKIQKNFIWDSTLTTRKIHPIAWDTVTRDKCEGGLGVRSAKHKNLVNLASLTWRILHNSEKPW